MFMGFKTKGDVSTSPIFWTTPNKLSSSLLWQTASPLGQRCGSQCLQALCSGFPLATPLPKGTGVCQAKRGCGHLGLRLPSGVTPAEDLSAVLAMLTICTTQQSSYPPQVAVIHVKYD